MGNLHHVIKAQQFDRPFLEQFFGAAWDMEQVAAIGGSRQLEGTIMATLFYQPSTRTRLSFEAAMLRLGGSVISTENAKEFSSAAKGESLEDTVRVVGGYADVIVLRHYELGSAGRAAAVSPVPVINAGDGPGQHPTQALLDLYTLQRELRRIDGIRVAMVGDLKHGRTVRSLSYLLAKFADVKIVFVSPSVCRMGDDIKDHLARHGTVFEETEDLAGVMDGVDVIYQTRVQKEAFAYDELSEEERASFERFNVTPELVARMKEGAVIMHPLPRVKEIATSVDADRRAAYFRQAKNGLFVRMALLTMVLGRNVRVPFPKELPHEDLDQ